MSESFLDLESWPEGIDAARIPANNNTRAIEAFIGPAISATTAAQPGSPAERDVYIIPASATGTNWATFAEGDVAIFFDSTWTAFAAFEGLRKTVLDEGAGGENWQYLSGAWAQEASAAPSRAPAIQSVVSAATVTPTFSDDMVKITAQAAALTLANPTGTAIPGLGMVIRIKDNGTARAISYGTQYRAIGVTLPTTTVISKTLYLACIWNATDTKMDVLAVGQEA